MDYFTSSISLGRHSFVKKGSRRRNFLKSAGEIMSEEACGRAVRERYKLPADGKMFGGAGVTVVSAPTRSSPQQAFGIWLQYVAQLFST